MGDRSCYKCGQTGHFARECPDGGDSRSGGGFRSKYFFIYLGLDKQNVLA